MAGCWYLGRRPGLDGLRGVAVLLVVVGHLFATGPLSWLSGQGVQVFFVLSGFLITSLLLDELEHTGRLALRRFYARRLRRLGPALLLVVAFVALVSLVVPSYANWPMLVGSLTWSANWTSISQMHHAGQGSLFGTPLGHTWSLSVEEQFYVLWPLLLVLLARLGRRAMLVGTLLGVLVTASLPFVLDDAVRVYYGSETRVLPLLAGCLLAMWLRGRPERPASRVQPALVAVGLMWVVWLTLVRYSLAEVEAQLVALATVVVIWAATQGGGVAFLEAPWLRLVGRRSYALYLWHWPIYVLLLRTVGPSPVVLALVGLPLAWVACELSWTYVERRFVPGPAPTPEVVPVPVSDLIGRLALASAMVDQRERTGVVAA